MEGIENILTQQPIFDAVCRHLSVCDKILFAISIGMLDHLYLKAVNMKRNEVWELILSAFPEHLSHSVLENLTKEQWKVVSGSKIEFCEETFPPNFRPPNSFVRKYAEFMDWTCLCTTYFVDLSEEFLHEFGDRVDWEIMSERDFPHEFTADHAHLLDWNVVSAREDLSEDFIEEFEDRVNWDLISEYQDLSEGFIDEFKHKINFKNLLNSEYAPSNSFIADLLTRAYTVY